MSQPTPPTTTATTTALREWNRLIQHAAASGSYSRCLRHYASLLAAGLGGGGASTFPSLAKSCAALRLPRLGAAVHAHALLAGAASAVFVRTSLLDMYAKCGRLPDARRLFDEMPRPTLVSWNCMVAAYGRSSQVEESVAVFNAMRRAGVRPSEGTLVGVLSGCVDSVSASNPGMCVYGFSVKSGLDAGLPVLNSVLTMLVRGSHLDAARLLFDGICNKSVVTWTALASGYLLRGDYLEVFDLFNRMRGVGQNVDSVVLVNLISAAVLFGNLSVAKGVHALIIKLGFECEEDLAASLINLYAKCGDLESAREVFDAVHMANVVVWTSMISGYVEGGHLNEALVMFDSMVCANIEPNEATLSSVLSACAKLGSANLGKKVEEQAIATGLHSEPRVATGLIDMYSKFGSINLARKIFEGVTNRDIAVWSAMINGYACNGEGSEALVLFKEMKNKGFQPDGIAFTHVLTACNYSGLVDEGLECFHSMTMEYGIEPSIEHHMCMADLLCKAGHFGSALKFFKQMPSEVQNKVLAPIISSYSARCADSSIDFIPEELLNLETQDSDHCVLMSNMLSCLGKWKKATSYRRQLSKQGLMKEPGWSCIELSG
ncbi:pentatricopeptide repeat-containing protein At4g04370-like [Oryza glaberrima]|uniref:Pentacotripeptide-repeat region of PRORP domain-containing protein n=1 Tax=Oryza glaberrima TaxID=4538 RepID=I1P0A9_ORYGL|nr:pentatricopeptide repeat-containing protein At4g04370-like [Oryza glaberrima]